MREARAAEGAAVVGVAMGSDTCLKERRVSLGQGFRDLSTQYCREGMEMGASLSLMSVHETRFSYGRAIEFGDRTRNKYKLEVCNIITYFQQKPLSKFITAALDAES